MFGKKEPFIAGIIFILLFFSSLGTYAATVDLDKMMGAYQDSEGATYHFVKTALNTRLALTDDQWDDLPPAKNIVYYSLQRDAQNVWPKSAMGIYMDPDTNLAVFIVEFDSGVNQDRNAVWLVGKKQVPMPLSNPLVDSVRDGNPFNWETGDWINVSPAGDLQWTNKSIDSLFVWIPEVKTVQFTIKRTE